MPIEMRQRLILCLHSVGEEPPATKEEANYWLPLDEFLPLFDQLYWSSNLNDFELELTCDDGFRSDYDDLLPWLVGRGLRATFFIPTHFIGRPDRVTSAHIREIHAAGMEIGSHGLDHVDWCNINQSQLHAEVFDSKSELEDLVGCEVSKAAPPFGSYNRTVCRTLKKAGYKTIYTCDGRFGTAFGSLRCRQAVQGGAHLENLLQLGADGPTVKDRIRQLYHLAKV